MESPELQIRRMREDDINEVWQIETDLFTMPWSESSFLYEVSGNNSSFPIVAIHEGRVAGYAIAWFLADELHIGNIAVPRAGQGRGAGKQILEYILHEAETRKVSIATLEVRVSNVRAISLYRKFGFRGVAVRKHYYTDTGEDALVMLMEVGQKKR